MDTLLAHTDPLSCVVVALLVDFLKPHRSWGWMRLVAGPAAYKTVPGLLGAKVMGSGHGGGFTLRPSATHQGLLCRFDNADHAMDFLHGEQVQAYRERARECWAGLMAVTSARGEWDQQSWGLSDADNSRLSPEWVQQLPEVQESQPLAVLTRASIHPARPRPSGAMRRQRRLRSMPLRGVCCPWAWARRRWCANAPSASGRTRWR